MVAAALLILFCALAPLHMQPLHGQAGKPFRLPVAAPPGPTTWLMGQPYGNTVGAYLRGREWYEAGQRLHFGIDLSMPCGTPLVAVGDGTVAFVDDLGFGSGPHNLLIRHDSVGVITLYGHLLDRPALQPGQPVFAGDVVGFSGDPDVTCDSRPHLHLEIRSLDYFTTYNPVDYIDANWNALTAIGSFSSTLFMQDLDNARRWMTLTDQPDVRFGGRPLNDYAAPYPDLREGQPPANPPLARLLDPVAEGAIWAARPLTFEGCCASAWWDAVQPGRLYAIDGNDNQRAAVFAWNTRGEEGIELLGDAPPPRLSADGTHQIASDGDGVRVRRLVDGAEWLVNTGGQWAGLSADNSRLLWSFTPEVTAGGDPVTTVWVSSADGTATRILGEFAQASAQWLDATRVLITSRDRIRTTLLVVDTADATAIPVTLGSWNWLRGLSIAPGGGRLMFYLVNQPDPAAGGVYMLEIPASGEAISPAMRLNWFGGWRWRDADSAFYLPLEPAQPGHTLHAYDFQSGVDRVLFDGSAVPLLVTNGNWSVSADGSQIIAWNAYDLRLWLIEGA